MYCLIDDLPVIIMLIQLRDNHQLLITFTGNEIVKRNIINNGINNNI